MQRNWRLMLIATGAILGAALVALAAPDRAHAVPRDATFQIALAGRVSSSQTSTDAQGNPVVAQTQVLHTDTGQYPAVALVLDLTEQSVAGQQRLTGTATLSDIDQQTAIFTATVSGTIDGNGLEQYTLGQAQPATGSGGRLTWHGLVRQSKLGDLTGTAAGVLVLPAGLSASVVASIWPGAANTGSGATSRAADPTLWYLTRGAALTAYLLLAATTALGIGISTRAFDSVARRPLVLDLHQVLTLLMVAFVALHLVTLLLDPFTPFSPAQLVWPLGEPYRPLWVALGVIGLYALAMVVFSSWARRFLAFGAWRALHYLSLVAFVALTLHGILAGTDTTTPWMLAIYVTSALAVAALLALRLSQAAGQGELARSQT
jgi:sulfoxide reductase heme-binding subunit YedZ